MHADNPKAGGIAGNIGITNYHMANPLICSQVTSALHVSNNTLQSQHIAHDHWSVYFLQQQAQASVLVLPDLLMLANHGIHFVARNVCLVSDNKVWNAVERVLHSSGSVQGL